MYPSLFRCEDPEAFILPWHETRQRTIAHWQILRHVKEVGHGQKTSLGTVEWSMETPSATGTGV